MIFVDLLREFCEIFECYWWILGLLYCTFEIIRCGPFGREDSKATRDRLVRRLCSAKVLFAPSCSRSVTGSAAFRVL